MLKQITTVLIAIVSVNTFGAERADVANDASTSRTTLVDPSQLDWNQVQSPGDVRFLLIHDMPDFMSKKKVVVGSRDLMTNLAAFKNLKALYLLAPDLSDDAVEALKSVKSLEAIALVDVQLSQKGARRLIQALPRLKTLALWNSDVVDAGALMSERVGLSVDVASDGNPSKYFDLSGCASGELFSDFDTVAMPTGADGVIEANN